MKKNILSNVKVFFRNKNGSVTIEFIFMLILLVFIFAFLADLVVVRSTQGKLDNASYSLTNILRERGQLYNDNGAVALNQNDLNEYEKLAKLMLFGDPNSPNSVGVTIEHWWQDNGSSKTEKLSNNNTCEPYRELDDKLAYLSPRSEASKQRKIPLYQVTLCVNVGSFFKTLIVKKENQSFGMLSSSSLTVGRGQ